MAYATTAAMAVPKPSMSVFDSELTKIASVNASRQ